MTKFHEILKEYDLNINYPDERIGPIAEIAPAELDSGLRMFVAGTFEEDGLENAKIKNITFLGYTPDFTDDELDKYDAFGVLLSLLNGNYRYELKKKSILDKICGAAIYLTIGDKGKEIVKDHRCDSQRLLKKKYADGELATSAYKKKSI